MTENVNRSFNTTLDNKVQELHETAENYIEELHKQIDLARKREKRFFTWDTVKTAFFYIMVVSNVVTLALLILNLAANHK
jgi:hypothetical protein